jgi:hypothetical protein
VGIVLAWGLWAATAVASTGTASPAAPAPTSPDRGPVCAVPAPAPAVTAGPGSTAITFTLVAPGCD